MLEKVETIEKLGGAPIGYKDIHDKLLSLGNVVPFDKDERQNLTHSKKETPKTPRFPLSVGEFKRVVPGLPIEIKERFWVRAVENGELPAYKLVKSKVVPMTDAYILKVVRAGEIIYPDDKVVLVYPEDREILDDILKRRQMRLENLNRMMNDIRNNRILEQYEIDEQTELLEDERRIIIRDIKNCNETLGAL